MSMNTMYNILLELPFFQGLCHEDITSILEKITLDFKDFNENQLIVQKGSEANQLIFVMDGRIKKESSTLNGKLTMEEIIRPPYVIEPQALFGLNTTFFSNYNTHSPVKLLIISKKALRNELFNYEVFKLNFLNYICYQNQKLNQQQWDLENQNIEERLLSVFWSLSDRNSLQQIIRVKMTVLARFMNSTRLNISKILNKWDDIQLIQLSRQEIIIPNPKKLLMYKDQIKREKEK